MYELIKCPCGGTVCDKSGHRNMDILRCDICGKPYPFYKLDYDMICTNSATGWVFPVKIKERTGCSMK